MISLKNTLAATVIGAALGSAMVSLPAQAEEKRISWSELAKKLEMQGYHIRELEIKHEGWKAEVLDREGIEWQLRLNRFGDVVRKKVDD